MKWVRGTCQFLGREAAPFVRSRRVTWFEKLDVLMPLCGFHLFLVGLLIIVVQGMRGTSFLHVADRRVGFALSVSLMTVCAPAACFCVELASQPGRLLRFLSDSFVAYAGLIPLSMAGLVGYLFTGRAIFLVTGDDRQKASNEKPPVFSGSSTLHRCLSLTHPDDPRIQTWEIVCSLCVAAMGAMIHSMPLLALSAAFAFQVVMHRNGWGAAGARRVRALPFLCLGVGVAAAFAAL
jgi:hypothetical protein